MIRISKQTNDGWPIHKIVANATIYSPAGELLSSFRHHPQPGQISDALTNIERNYQALAAEPRYKHFVRIPERILRCIDYFGVGCNRAKAKARLHSYYLFIGVVDNAIDSGNVDTGERILQYLSAPGSFREEILSSSLRLVTEILRGHISAVSSSSMIERFRELYQTVISEREAESIEAYIEHRRAVGRLTATLSYELISPLLERETRSLLRFMNQVGEVGCLVDSVIDLDADRRIGLLRFQPNMIDRARLIVCTLQAGLRVLLRHPGLCGLFLQAITDNVRDRFRGQQTQDLVHIVASRKDEPAIVA